MFNSYIAVCRLFYAYRYKLSRLMPVNKTEAVDILLHTFLISILALREWSDSHAGRFSLHRMRPPYWFERGVAGWYSELLGGTQNCWVLPKVTGWYPELLGGIQSRSVHFREQKILDPAGIDPKCLGLPSRNPALYQLSCLGSTSCLSYFCVHHFVCDHLSVLIAILQPFCPFWCTVLTSSARLIIR
jgi:hypothetical protein